MNRETIELRNLGIGYTTKHGVITVAEGINGTICSRELTDASDASHYPRPGAPAAGLSLSAGGELRKLQIEAG